MDASHSTMAALDGLTASEKDELVVSLSALLCADAGVELSEENISAVVTASGNSTTSASIVGTFAATLEKAGGVDLYLQAPGEGK